MRCTSFGHRTGPRVCECALGTANFGTRWGAGAGPDGARRIFDRFAEAGGTFLDTADTYRFGESEELTGKFVFVPITGPRNLTQLDDCLSALDVQLTHDQFACLSDVSAVPLGVPHEAIAGSLGGIQGGDSGRVIAPAAAAA
ncbi:aldo/keto reductase [Streptomyces sp. NPDC059994]|uniref:aldo/keto reductase n=1 Tax=Streptomyces sp. NPDC059994 TaxID=3347029 RepID=UPI0036C27BFB